MKTVRLIAKKTFGYAQRTLRAGQAFHAEEHHVKMLIATGRAAHPDDESKVKDAQHYNRRDLRATE